MTTTKALAEALAEARDDLLKDTREVFDANGSETPQVVRYVIEYVASWLDVFIGRLADAQAAEQAAGGGEAVPVAWRAWRGDSYELFFNEDSAKRRCECFVRKGKPEPLYTRPELSDAEIDAIAKPIFERMVDRGLYSFRGCVPWVLETVRAALAARGGA